MVAKTESTESISAGNSYSEDAVTTGENKIVIDDDIMIDSMQRKNDKDDHPSQPKSISTVVVSCNDKFHDWIDRHVNEDLRFAIRVTVALSISSLFVLCQSPDPNEEVLPSAFWVYLTAGVTSFQASPDNGAVMKKSWQRFLGTIIGGLIGLAAGSITIVIPVVSTSESTIGNNPYVWQALYIGITQIFCSFVMVYWAVSHGYRSHYSAILGTVTMGIALFAFYTTDVQDGWKKGVFRIANIAIGGIVGSIVSLTVFPVSTKRLIERKVQQLIVDTGIAARMVLSSTAPARGTNNNNASSNKSRPSFHAMAIDPNLTDAARESIVRCGEGRQKIKSLLTLLDYDLTFKRKSTEEKRRYIESWNIVLDRLRRMHNNISWIDNILRSNLIGGGDESNNDHHETDADASLDHDLLRRVGERCEEILDLSNLPEDDRSNVAAELLSDDYIRRIRSEIERATERRWQHRRSVSLKQRKAGSSSTTTSIVWDNPSVSTDELLSMIGRFDDVGTRRFTKRFIDDQTDTFYRMVEILILRCVRQHQLNVVLTDRNRSTSPAK